MKFDFDTFIIHMMMWGTCVMCSTLANTWGQTIQMIAVETIVIWGMPLIVAIIRHIKKGGRA